MCDGIPSSFFFTYTFILIANDGMQRQKSTYDDDDAFII